ncbi:hypothetical protein LINGRAHAP2_LOCUS18597 [Linum grandiflorum]
MTQSSPVFNVLDPISLILSHNSSDSLNPSPLKLTAETSYFMERGPRYSAYAELRESKLRTRTGTTHFPEESEETDSWPPAKKQVKFKQLLRRRVSGYGVVAQSVPDFSATLRKENRKPTHLPPVGHLTPPPCKSGSKLQSCSSRGSRSVGSGEKRTMAARKSYANVEELKGLSMVNGESRRVISGGGSRGNGGKTVLGYRQLF